MTRIKPGGFILWQGFFLDHYTAPYLCFSVLLHHGHKNNVADSIRWSSLRAKRLVCCAGSDLNYARVPLKWLCQSVELLTDDHLKMFVVCGD